MRLEVTDISPARAIELMGENANNRSISRARVNRLVTEIRSGNWQLNGETVIISQSGKLLDGQHRLAAVALSGQTVRMAIAYDAPEDAVSTIDTGRSRSNSDILTIRGIDGGHKIAAATGTFWRMMVNAHPVAILPASYAMTIIERYPAFSTWTERVNKAATALRLVPNAGLIASLVYLTSVANREDLAERLFSGLSTGAGLQDGDPVLALRNRMLNRRPGERRRTTQDSWPALMRTVSALESNTPVYRVHLGADGAVIARPERIAQHFTNLSREQRLADLENVGDMGSLASVPGFVKRRSYTKRRKAD